MNKDCNDFLLKFKYRTKALEMLFLACLLLHFSMELQIIPYHQMPGQDVCLNFCCKLTMFGKRGLTFLSLHGSCLPNKGTLSIPSLFHPPPVLPAIPSNKHNTVIWNMITPNWMLSYEILIFAPCLVFWVISLSIREMLEGWKGIFVGKVMGLCSE